MSAMAFRALLFSKSSETNTAMSAACESTGIRAEVCTDIFTAIEKVKSRSYSCVIPDWADQPEASFLLKRARESTPNRDTIGVAIVDNEPTAAEMRDNRLDFLIYRPISVQEANEVLGKASEQMKPLSAQDLVESISSAQNGHQGAEAVDTSSTESPSHLDTSQEDGPDQSNGDSEVAIEHGSEFQGRGHAIGMREAFAALLLIAAIFCMWRSRETLLYLARTPEGTSRVFRESVAALFYLNPTGALPLGSAGSDARQDAYFSRNAGASNTQSPSLGVAATQSNFVETRLPLPRASDFPLPVPVFERVEEPPVHRTKPTIPDSMRNSPPIARPVVVTVNPAQMMPVSAPQSQTVTMQPSNEPVSVSEEAQRALLIHLVDPVYPPEGLAQKLHGAVVLQASISREGTVEDLKIVRGYFILGRAAIAAVKQWRFQPYTVNGRPSATQTQITITFNSPTA